MYQYGRREGKYRKEMKSGNSKRVYHQRSKDGTIFSVIKRKMGDEGRSVRKGGQNNEMRFRVIAYNAARIASLVSSLLEGFYRAVFTFVQELAYLCNQRKRRIGTSKDP